MDERFLRQAVDASGEVIFTTDLRGTITYVNPEFVRVYGYRPEDVVGRTTPRILKGGTTSVEEYEDFWRRLSEHKIVRKEFTNKTKDGDTVQVETSANPIASNGQVIGFLAVQRVITARKEAEAALLRSEARYRALADAAHDSIFIVNRQREIQYANAISAERFGVPLEQALGKRLDDVFPIHIAEQMWSELSKVFHTAQRHYCESCYELPKGELWLESWLVPMLGSASTPDAVMGVARDITDRKHLEQQFLQAQKMEAIGRLAGGIAHDFNNLVTVIIGYSELVAERVRNDSALAADVDEVKRAGERASRLTRQLLAFSRKQVMRPQVLDLNEVVTDLYKMLDRVIGEDIQLEVVAGPGLAQVSADPGHVEQIVMNLAVNARDAMPKGGTLRISTANTTLDADFVRRHTGASIGQYVSLSLTDNGCGMTPEILAHVFEPFFTTKGVGKGTGLGLATVYGIVKQSSGYISIDSAPGQGTTVTIYLPAMEGHRKLRATAAPQQPIPSGKETILVVEDEPSLKHLMKRTLEHYGYTVLVSKDVEDAMTIAANHPAKIDLLLSDVIMPGLNGPDLAQHIVALRPTISVLYVSGFSNIAASGFGVMSSKASLLSKPFTAQTLGAKVRECLDRECKP